MSIAAFLPGWVRRPIARMIELVTPSNQTVRTRWLRRPQIRPDAEVCLFASYAADNRLAEHSLFHARAWADAGFQVILIINTDSFNEPVEGAIMDSASGVLLRENRGYDFGAWASALEQLPEVRQASLVALANDSVYGPLDTFGLMLERARKTDADVIGATESVEFGRHFQSFLIFFKPTALNSGAFWRFWGNVRAGGRIVAIYRYELGLLRALELEGLRSASLFPNATSKNPTLTRWRELVDAGFPYVKVVLFRQARFASEIVGWHEVLKERGYDPSMIISRAQSTSSPENGIPPVSECQQANP